MALKIKTFLFVVFFIVVLVSCNRADRTEEIKPGHYKQTPEGWTDTPSLAIIPNAPISGFVNGMGFVAEEVYFEPVFGKWNMIITDVPLGSPTAITTDGQRAVISLLEYPAEGKIIEKKKGRGGGYFNIRKKKQPERIISWNSDNAYIIKLTKWELKDWDETGEIIQIAGKASGKMYLSYTGRESGEFDDTFLSGEFVDALVRYTGRPSLDY